MAEKSGNYQIVLSTRLDTTQIKTDLQKIEKLKLNISVNMNEKSLERLRELNKLLNETKALNNFTNGLVNIQKTMQSYEKVAGKTLTATKNLADSMQAVGTKSLKSAGEIKTFGDKVKEAFSKFSLWSVVSAIFYKVVRSVEGLVNTALELDKAFTELTKVTDLTIEDFDELTEKAYNLGSTLAKTTTEVIEAMTEFAKAGYSVEESTNILAKNALMWTNISDGTISATESANMIISVMKAFNIEAEDTTHIIDALNEVSNNFAISSGDLSDSLAKSSAVLANAGVTYEEMLGLITAGTEVIRNANTVSTGLRTISLRLQGMEEDGTKVSGLTAKLEKNFNNLGLTLYDANGNLKDTYEVLQELSEIFPDLNTEQKAYYTELIAGKTRAQVAAAILNNFSRAIDATGTAYKSAGSAAKENEKVLNSLNGHIKTFKSEWESLVNSKATQDVLKFIVDIGTNLLKIINALGGLKTILLSTLAIIILIKRQSIALLLSDISKTVIMLSHNIQLANSITIGFKNTFSALTVTTLAYSAAIAAVIIGISLIRKEIDYLSKEHERNNEAVEDSLNEYKKLIDEQKDIEEQIKKIDERLDELNRNKIDIIDGETVTKLKETRKELELQLAIKKKLAEIEKRGASGSAKSSIYGAGSYTRAELESAGVDTTDKERDAKRNAYIAFGGWAGLGYVLGEKYLNWEGFFKETTDLIDANDNLSKSLIEQDESLKKLQSDYANGIIKEKEYKKQKEEIQTTVKDLNEKLDKNSSMLNTNMTQLLEYREALDENNPEDAGLINVIDFVSAKVIALGEDFKTFDDVWAKVTKDEKIRLRELVQSGKYDLHSFEEEFPRLSAYFSKLADETGTAYINYIEKVKDVIQTPEQFVDATDYAIEKLKNHLTEDANAYKTLSSAVEEYQENGELSVSTLLELLEKYPEKLKYLNEEGWTLENVNKILRQSAEETINAAKKENELALQNAILEFSYVSLSDGLTKYVNAVNKYMQAIALYAKRKKEIEDLENAPFGFNNSSGGSGSKKDLWKEEFTKKYNELKTQRDLDKINEKEYYDYLEELNDKYFKNRKEYEDEYSKYLVEIYKGRKSLFKDYIDDLEHQAKLAENRGEDPETIIDIYKKMQEELHDRAEYYRKQGIDENNELIQELQDQWWSYQKTIEKIQKQIADDLKDSLDEQLKETKKRFEDLRDVAIDVIENQIKEKENALEEQNKLIDEQIDKLKEEKDTMDDEKEIQNKLLKIEEARKKLAEAKNKKVRIYREGRGFVYESDFDAVNAAQQELNNLLDDWNLFQEKARISEIIDSLEKEKDANKERVDQEIADLNRLKDAWDKSLDLAKNVEDYQGWLQRIEESENDSFDERLQAVKTFVEAYNNEMELLKSQYEAAGLEFTEGEPNKETNNAVKTYNGVQYDPSVDYQKLINDAVASNAPLDHLAYLEKKRNAKIMGENIKEYQPTYNYTTKDESSPYTASSGTPSHNTAINPFPVDTGSPTKKSSSSSASSNVSSKINPVPVDTGASTKGSSVIDKAKDLAGKILNTAKSIFGLADGTTNADGLMHFVGEERSGALCSTKGFWNYT